MLQGPFDSVLIQEERSVMEVARYIHLNPVRIGGLGLSKSDQRWAGRRGDWGRDGVMYVAVRHGGLRLAEVVRAVGIRYQAAAQG